MLSIYNLSSDYKWYSEAFQLCSVKIVWEDYGRGEICFWDSSIERSDDFGLHM